MEDRSYLDKKYFIDDYVYNCPFCNRRNVRYFIESIFDFDWTATKNCYGHLVKCTSCKKESMHLSFEIIYEKRFDNNIYFKGKLNIDSKIFYSVPTSFFVMDERIPSIIRELITESEGCLKMNFLTGASACMRKAIYELLIREKAEGDDYESRIKYLKQKYPNVDPIYFDILAKIKDMTSDKIHEQSWDKWNSKNLKFIIETLKAILNDIYVEPKVKEERKKSIEKMKEDLVKDKEDKKDETKLSEGTEGGET